MNKRTASAPPHLPGTSRRAFLQTGTTALLGVGAAAAHAASAQQPAAPFLGNCPTGSLPRIGVHPAGHLLQTADGSPFFWLGDTAWQLIHSTTREECSYYLHTRARQGFTVIQTVALSEFNGVTQPSATGLLPFTNNDPSTPNEDFFHRVVEIVDEAATLGLYIALVPAWGDKLTAPWGAGPRIFRNDNLDVAHQYAKYLARTLKDRANVLWLLGGDRPAHMKGVSSPFLQKTAQDAGIPLDADWTPIWRAMADGLKQGTGATPTIVYHPQGGEESSSVQLPHESWLSVNGMQSGHGGGHDMPVWNWIERDYAITPPKPTLDLEPNYEDHPYNPWPTWDPATGYFRDHDVRKQTYRSIFAGGCGVTYGHHAVWQFANARNGIINHADRDWIDALYRPAARQMVFLRLLLLSRPYFRRIPDQGLIAGDPGKGSQHLQATRDREGTYAFIYFPMNDQTATINFSSLKSQRLRAWWYDPRTGIGTLIPEPATSAASRDFRSPPYGPDWVLVLDDAGANYAPPGLSPWSARA